MKRQRAQGATPAHQPPEDNSPLGRLGGLASGAFGLLASLREEARAQLHAEAEALAAKMNLVPRRDADELRAMISAARSAQEKLEARLSALESRFESNAHAAESKIDAKMNRQNPSRVKTRNNDSKMNQVRSTTVTQKTRTRRKK